MYRIFILFSLFGLIFQTQLTAKEKPVVYTIGDSTVKNGRGDGSGGLWGWGDPFALFFDTTKVKVENHALGGTSSRTFQTKGLWEAVRTKLKKGDYVLMQFGHNDGSALNDSSRARGTIKGVGEERVEIDNILTKEHETVHSYGWYLRKIVRETKEKGAIPVIITPIPRNDWGNGKIRRTPDSYPQWALQVARQEKIQAVDLNRLMSDKLDTYGEANVTGRFFYSRDHTHTSAEGAVMAASIVVEGLKAIPNLKLKGFLLKDPKIVFPPQKREFPVTQFGAAGDGKSLDTKAIQSAIDQCSTSGGGVVVVPQGTFLSGAIFLKQGVDLRIDKDGVLKGTTNIEDYPAVATRWEGEERQWTSALVNAFDMNNFTLAGEGMIDGSGEKWLELNRGKRADPTAERPRYGSPRLIALQNCKNSNLANLNLKNQACWCVFILYSKDIEVKNLTIRAEHNIPMSDGIDVDSSNGIHIIGCDIDVNDDCIAIKSGKDEDGRRVNRPCENIVVEKCTFRYGHGGVSMGSEVSGGIRNVVIQNCVMEADNWAPIRFKCQPSRGGVVENITYRDIVLKDTRKAFEFNMEWRMVNPKPASDPLPVFRNVRIINVSGTTATVGDMHGLKDSPVRNVVFENCNITAKRGFILDNVEEIDLTGLKIKVAEGEPIIWKK
jgi:lysophospholipase L1-like esterase